jgi:hypothetical protein
LDVSVGRRRLTKTILYPACSLRGKGVAAIIRVTGGNFRLRDRLLTQVGRILELNGLKVVTREVVEAAREVLVVGTA